MNTDAAKVWQGLKEAIVALNDTMPEAQTASDWDKWTIVHGGGATALQQMARDRVTAVPAVQGPRRGPTGCTETMIFGVGTLYLDKAESNERMVVDVPPMRELLWTLSTKIPGVKSSTPEGPFYDYESMPEACVVTWAVAIEYHVALATGG